jgi:putative transposase
LAKLCGWFGITRQAYYQKNWTGAVTTLEEDLILKQVQIIRKNHSRIGTRKLYAMLSAFLAEHNLKMGRDALFGLLSANCLLIRRRRKRIQTTNSLHWLRKYPNLIKGFVPTASNQLWVSDITYWKLNGSHVYISFITDVYSHKIVGYHLGKTLEAIESIQALKMALSSLGTESALKPIHHSDRGVQYCSQGYVKLLQDYNFEISMTENGDPLENAIAERINGIIKDEYLDTYRLKNQKDAREFLKAAVDLYNNERPHMSIGNLTPNQVHQKQTLKTTKLWKSYYRKETAPVNQF